VSTLLYIQKAFFFFSSPSPKFGFSEKTQRRRFFFLHAGRGVCVLAAQVANQQQPAIEEEATAMS